MSLWAWAKKQIYNFSAPLGILETQGLSWMQVQGAQAHPTTLQASTPTAGWARHQRFCTHSLTQSPNPQCRNTLHFSENQECPFLNVLNSITETALVSWFCITTANWSSQGAATVLQVPNWYKCPRGIQTQLCYPKLCNATVSFIKTPTKCPFKVQN